MQNKKNKGFTQHHFLKIKKGAKNLFNTTFYVKKKSGAGFTLVEVLVGVIVFALAISIAVGIFVHVLQSQRKALAYQELFDQTSFIVEYMTRGIRMAKKHRPPNTPAGCIIEGHNYQLVGPNHLKFIRRDYLAGPDIFVCYEFFLYTEYDPEAYGEHRGTLRVTRDGDTFDLTSHRLDVETLKFEIKGDKGDDPGYQYQPRVTIVLEVKGREYGHKWPRPKIHFQTTVSQRDLDFPFSP